MRLFRKEPFFCFFVILVTWTDRSVLFVSFGYHFAGKYLGMQ